MPKYFIALLSFFLLFVIAVLSLGIYLVYQNSKPYSSFSVTEIVKQKVKPDQATVQLFVSQTGTDIKKMNIENDTITAKVTDYLLKNGVTKNKIKTNKNSYPDYNFGYSSLSSLETQKPENRTVVESIIDVEFVSLDNNPNAIVDETLSLGVNRYGQFSYKTKDLKVICDQVEIDAEKNVKTKADLKVKNLGGNVVKAQYGQTYTTGCENSLGGSVPTYDAKTTSMSGAVPNIMTGEQEVSATASLNVEYR
jgi:uncharacterized protein YggE